MLRSSLCLLLAVATAHAAVSPLGSPSLRRAGGAGAILRSLRKESDDTGAGAHSDPDSVVPQGDDKADERVMSCSQLRNLNLRGGGLEEGSSAGEKLQIVFVSAEIAPWSITGGLGAVCDGLPRAMAKLGHRVMSIAPRYDQYYDAWDTEFTAEVPLADGMTTVRFFHAFKKGVDRVFVDHPLFLEKVWGQTKQKLYGPKWGKDYEDNQLRFAMFCKAAMVATEKLSLGGFPYGQDVTFVANDWHAALLPMYIKDEQTRGSWMNAKSATLLHNMVFQGRFPYDPKCAERLHLPQAMIDSFVVTQPLKVGKQKKQVKGLKSTEQIPNPAIECVNFILGGILNSDQTLTVSPGYAREIVQDPSKGAEMSKHVSGVIGILNGVEDIVDPSNTELGLDVQYDQNSLEVKSELKITMQKSLGFAVGQEIPLFVFMGRLDAQKGVDIMFESIDAALQKGLNVQFVVMGSGIEELEEVAADLEDKYPTNFKAILSFKGVEKYKTYAAADFALMPSRYEPCGLVQMEGMRFGTLPIVAPTGGLADTVKDMETGIVMEAEVDDDTIVQKDVDMIVSNIERAQALYASKDKLRQVQKNAMAVSKSYTWQASAEQYISTFKKMGSKPPARV